MNRPLSLYLDLVRFLAAMIVFLGHLSGKRFTAGLFWQTGELMDEAVIIFFVLSGFVISHVVRDRGEDRDSYIVARTARIASVALPALVATALLDWAGRSLHPELYSADWGFSAEAPLLQYLSAALFVSRVWYASANIGSNLPYWSLSFEVWYYVIFGLAWFARGRARMLGLAAALLISGPVILSLFPLWLCGLVAQRCCAAGRVGPRAGMLLLLASGPGLVLYLALRGGIDTGFPPLRAFPDEVRMLHEYAVAVLFAATLVGVSAAAPRLASLVLPFARPIRWLAGATFSVYLFHLPLAQFLTTVVPWPPEHPLARLVILGGSLVLIFLVAEFTERRKAFWMPFARGVLGAVKSVAALLRPGEARASL